MKKLFIIFINGLSTGLFLQFAIGPVFFFIINLSLQRTIYDGLIAVLAVTLVDYFYIILSVIGIGKLLEKEKIKNIVGITSSLILIIFGIILLYGILNNGFSSNVNIETKNLFSSFVSAFFLTISNPLTIIFFTGLFTSKAVESNYTKTNLYIFGFSVGLATLIFMGSSVIIFTLLKEVIPVILIKILNCIVGIVLICYGIIRMIQTIKKLNK